jgi:hypothetical protein
MAHAGNQRRRSESGYHSAPGLETHCSVLQRSGLATRRLTERDVHLTSRIGAIGESQPGTEAPDLARQRRSVFVMSRRNMQFRKFRTDRTSPLRVHCFAKAVWEQRGSGLSAVKEGYSLQMGVAPRRLEAGRRSVAEAEWNPNAIR